MSKTRILLADDHCVVRKGLRFLLERRPDMEVVGEAQDGREAIRLAGELQPEIVIMDVEMPLLNGIEATAQIVKHNPRIGVIILSMHGGDGSLVRRALSAGAKGYVLKDSSESDIVVAVEGALQGRPFLSPQIAVALQEDYPGRLRQTGVQDSYDLLTDREKETLLLVAKGKTNKEMATLLNLSVYTVETHRANLMQKLNLHSTAEIVHYAVRQKIIA